MTMARFFQPIGNVLGQAQAALTSPTARKLGGALGQGIIGSSPDAITLFEMQRLQRDREANAAAQAAAQQQLGDIISGQAIPQFRQDELSAQGPRAFQQEQARLLLQSPLAPAQKLGAEIFGASLPPPPSNFERLLSSAGITDPQERANLLRQRIEKEVSTRPTTQINLGAGDTELQKALAKSSVKKLEEGQVKRESALESLDFVSQARNALEGGSLVGPGSEALLVFGELANFVGFDVDKDTLANTRILKQAGDKITTELFSKFKGALSDSEREFARQIAPNIGTSKEALVQMLDLIETASNREVALQEFREDFLNQNQTLRGVEKPLREFRSQLFRGADIFGKKKRVAPTQNNTFSDITDAQIQEALRIKLEQGI